VSHVELPPHGHAVRIWNRDRHRRNSAHAPLSSPAVSKKAGEHEAAIVIRRDLLLEAIEALKI
jgi:hypothetical protein